jgi:Skp family chaperone for outer membrane proteins
MSRSWAAITLWALMAPAALAATTSPEPAGSTGLGGPLVPGVCVLSQEAVLSNAKAGVAASQRLAALAQAAQAPLQTERAAIESDSKALEAQKATLPAADYKQRRQALAQRAQAYQAEQQQLSRRVEATREGAIRQIDLAAQPLAADAYHAHNCGILFNRNMVLGGNMGNDLTPDVVAALDAKLTSITFDLAPPPAPAGAAPAR